MRRLFLLALACGAPALAQTGQSNDAVTIYNNNRDLVQDTRQLTIPASRSRQEFPDVSAQMRPETVTLSGERRLWTVTVPANGSATSRYQLQRPS
jgi:hypothetical protein